MEFKSHAFFRKLKVDRYIGFVLSSRLTSYTIIKLNKKGMSSIIQYILKIINYILIKLNQVFRLSVFHYNSR